MNFPFVFILLLCTSTATIVDKREAGNTTFYLENGYHEELCIQRDFNILKLWNVQVVTISSSKGFPSIEIDSPDSSLLRTFFIIIGKYFGGHNYNSNKLYEYEEIKSESKYTVYLSPFGTSCFNISIPLYLRVGDIVQISWEDEFDIFFLVRLLLGACLLMLSSSLSQSKSFYYVSAATLSAVLGLLIVIYYVMRQMQAKNSTISVAALIYSLGVSTLFRRTALSVIWRLCIENYRIVIIYTAIFAFIGVGIVRLKIFASPTSRPTSLFEVVRWGLVIVSLSLILTSSSSVIGSAISFVLLWLGIELIRFTLRKLYVK